MCRDGGRQVEVGLALVVMLVELALVMPVHIHTG
jgi:hypothetical protein